MSEEKSEAQWFALRSQVKREGLAAKSLRQLEGVEVFLPQIRYRKSTRRGPVWWVEALFPGYLLAKFDATELARAVSYAQGVSKVVSFGGVPVPVDEHWIETLRAEVAKLENEDGLVTIQPELGVGDQVEINSGPLQGAEGTVTEIRPAKERVSLLIEFMGSPTVLQVSLFDLLLPNRSLPDELSF